MDFYGFYTGKIFDAYEFLGAHPDKDGTTFRTFAPAASRITVIGEFNDWQEWELNKTYDGNFWECYAKGAKPGMMYKYRIYRQDGNCVEHCDPYGFGMELRPAFASIIRDLSHYKFKDSKWMQKRSVCKDKPLNIYELHFGSFKKPSEKADDWYTYVEMIDILIPYLKENDYNYIEIMPLSEHPCDESWGYQNTGFFSPTARYGTAEELMKFIDACHKNDIGVIMDFVPVHFVRDDFSLSYFDGTPLYEYEKAVDADSQWGTANFNLWREEVRSFLMSAASFWIDKYHVDGLRMDAISNVIHWHGNKDLGENEGALHFIKRMNYNLHHSYPGVMLIAEDSSDFPKVTAPTIDGGLGFDYKWDLGWMNDTLKYLEKDPVYRKWHHNNITFSMAYFYSEKFIMEFSHDEVVHGKKTIVDKIWGTYEEKFKQLRTLYLYMFTHPGKKLNFMGNELAHFREWDETKQCDWDLLTYPIHDAFHKYFAKLGDIYKKTQALYCKEYDWNRFEWIDADNEDENLFSYMRKSDDRTYIIILNFSPNMYKAHPFGVYDNGTYKEILNTEQDIYGGTISELQKVKAVKQECNNKPYTIAVDVPAFGGVLLEYKKRKPSVKKKDGKKELVKK